MAEQFRNVPDLEAELDENSLRSAVEESEAFEQEVDLEKLAKKNQHARTEHFRNHFNWALIIAFWLFFGVVVLGGGIWAFHLFMPERLHFLSISQVSKIESTFLSSVVAATLSVLARNRYL